jgi:hypothetical protein
MLQRTGLKTLILQPMARKTLMRQRTGLKTLMLQALDRKTLILLPMVRRILMLQLRRFQEMQQMRSVLLSPDQMPAVRLHP